MGPDETPRHRLLRRGPEALSDAELLSVLLEGRGRGYALACSRRLLRSAGGLGGLAALDTDLVKEPGFGRARASAVLAAVEMARRLAEDELREHGPLDRPDAIARYLALRYGKVDQEVAGAVLQDSRGCLLGVEEIFRGTLARVWVDPAIVLRRALRRKAVMLVLFHTHPSGNPEPSREDLVFTRRFAQAASVVGIGFLDHLIVGSAKRWTSLRHRGYV